MKNIGGVMILLTIGAILLTLFIFFIIGFITFMMFVDKATPQIYYTPCESVTVKTKVNIEGRKVESWLFFLLLLHPGKN